MSASSASSLTAAAETVDDLPTPEEAKSAVRLGLWVSGVRCMIVYVVAPAAAGLGGLLHAVGLLVQVLGTITSISGTVTLWRTRHRARYGYTVISALVLLTTCAAALSELHG